MPLSPPEQIQEHAKRLAEDHPADPNTERNNELLKRVDEYIVESNARVVQLNLPRRYYQTLPALTEEPYRGLPRIYSLAKKDERPIHVGTYLIGEKRHVLARLIRGRESLRFRTL